uniref:Uncharacterized protein n=1 Tax=Amorphochlora amoebiformis TaxID=1561963 RepID=A0A0H5BIL9_9EUKA|nr:hypothetical protein [Amorphochlora amoebiformis]
MLGLIRKTKILKLILEIKKNEICFFSSCNILQINSEIILNKKFIILTESIFIGDPNLLLICRLLIISVNSKKFLSNLLQSILQKSRAGFKILADKTIKNYFLINKTKIKNILLRPKLEINFFCANYLISSYCFDIETIKSTEIRHERSSVLFISFSSLLFRILLLLSKFRLNKIKYCELVIINTIYCFF